MEKKPNYLVETRKECNTSAGSVQTAIECNVVGLWDETKATGKIL